MVEMSQNSWLTRRLSSLTTVQTGGENFRSAQPDRFGCVLIHGWAGSPAEMRPVGDCLAAQGIDVLGVRLPGHGTSHWDFGRYGHQDWLQAVEQALEEYFQEKDRVVLCGFSMGGLIALRLAAEHADDPRIVGLVTMSAPLQFRQGRGARRAHLARIWHRLRTRQPYLRKPDAATQLVNYNLVGPRAVLELMRLIAGTAPLLDRIHQPILILQSFNDPTVPPFNAELIYNRVRSREKHLVWVNESGHLITVDLDAETVAQEVAQFVRRLRDSVVERAPEGALAR